MKNKGFTLIELLAVIVILAIIALIATPIVVNIISDAKKSSQEESIKMYAKAIEDGVANYFLRNPNKKEVPTIEELQEGKYINYKGNIDCEETKIYPNGKIYLGKCSVGGTEVTYTYGEKEKTLCTLDGEKTGTEEINRGDKYKCEVIKGMKEPYTFYVLGTEGTGKNQKVNLIMDRNICRDGTIDYANDLDNNYCKYAWESNNVNGNGPITAMTALGNGTRNWNNVPNMNLEYDDITDQVNAGYTGETTYGYGGINIEDGIGKIIAKDGTTQTPITLTDNMPIKARLPKFSEVYKEQDDNYCNYSGGTGPMWLVKNLYYDTGFSGYCNACVSKYSDNQNNGITDIYGYWLLSSNPGYSGSARYVDYSGIVGTYSAYYTGDNGVRAVITVSKSDLS